MFLIKNPNILEENISESEIMIFNTETEEIHILNSTATEIYFLLSEALSENEVTKKFVDIHIKESYNGSCLTESDLIADVKNTIALLLNLNILKTGEHNE